MKRALCIVLILVLALSFAGCSKIKKIIDVLNETDAPAATLVPETEAPADTSKPTSAPEATAEPTDAPDADFVIIIRENVEYSFDIDSDGIPDKVKIDSSVINEWGEKSYTVTISRGARPENSYAYTVDYCYDFGACVLDCYAGDGRLEILISYAQDSDDWTTCGFRVNDSGTAIDCFDGYFCVSAESMRGFTLEKGFLISGITDIWGTHVIEAYFKVGQYGFDRLSMDYTYYIYSEEYMTVTLLRPLEAVAVNEDGSLGEAVTVPAGEGIIPLRTDNATYVIMKIASTGQLIKADVEIHSWDGDGDWGIFISGVKQEEYAEIMYAD